MTQQLKETSQHSLNQQMAIFKTRSEQEPEAYKAGHDTMAKPRPWIFPAWTAGMSWKLSLVTLACVLEELLVHEPTCFAVRKFDYCFHSSPCRVPSAWNMHSYVICPAIFFLFPHMEWRLMFHTLWTNSSCHGYDSLEFPVSWVIKFPTLILLYWFISVTPYFLGLLALREQSRTFHRLLVSSQAFAFCAPGFGKIEGVFPQGVSSSRQYTWAMLSTPEAKWALGSVVGTPASSTLCYCRPHSLAGQPAPMLS